MARLVVNPDCATAWEIQLRPGLTSLGRGSHNDICLPDPSVSTSHCQIIIDDGRAIIKDLGSSNGTCLDGTPIRESILLTGQNIRLGSLEIAFYVDTAPPSAEFQPPLRSPTATLSAQPPLEPVIYTEPKYCKIHLQTSAKYFCPQCCGLFCEICVSSGLVNGQPQKTCRKCNRVCLPVRIQIQATPQKGLYSRVPGAFLYPLRGAGILMLLVGTVMFGALKFAAAMGGLNGMMGSGGIGLTWWGLMLQVIIMGYMFCYMQNIIHSTALEEVEMPSLPDVTSFWDDILLPCFQLIGATLISFAPLILLGTWLLLADARASGPVLMSLSFLGCAYFPMAFLAVAILDTVAAANPLQVVPSVLKVPLEYFVALCVLGTVFVARALGDVVLHLAFPKGLITHSLSRLIVMLALQAFWGLVSFYLLTVGIRILGLLYVTRKRTLGWLSR
jgi:hypothetical protein